MELTHIVHPFPPLYDPCSEVLILGSFPSIKSREQQFFYGHPQNRFWKVVAAVFNTAAPVTIQEKKDFLHSNHLALWDSIYSCDIRGSSDSSVKNAVPTDLSEIINSSKIRAVFCNGNLSGKMYVKYHEKVLNIPAIVLPSTSPANASYSLDTLVTEWKCIRTVMDN